jgi:hypothetical protein
MIDVDSHTTDTRRLSRRETPHVGLYGAALKASVL